VFIDAPDDKPLSHHRQSHNVKHSQPAVLDLRSYGMRGDEGYAEPRHHRLFDGFIGIDFHAYFGPKGELVEEGLHKQPCTGALLTHQKELGSQIGQFQRLLHG